LGVGTRIPSTWSSAHAPVTVPGRAASEYGRWCREQLHGPGWRVLLGFVGNPNPDSPWPAPRCLLPSYFRAISRRCQASSAAGVTMVVNSCSLRQPNFLALTAKCRRCSSLKPQPLGSALFPQDTILFLKIVDDVLLLLVHPASQGNQ